MQCRDYQLIFAFVYVGVHYDIMKYGMGLSNSILWCVLIDLVELVGEIFRDISWRDSTLITEALHKQEQPMFGGSATFAETFRDFGLNMHSFARQLTQIMVRNAWDVCLLNVYAYNHNNDAS